MKARDVLNILHITHKTLGTYVKSGKLNPHRINSHHYEYDPEEVYALIGKGQERYNVTYSRVSLPKQRNDLESQTQRLYDFAVANGYQIKEQITDIKSGMAFDERKGFMKLLDKVTKYEVKAVIVENKDRLARFGFDLIRTMFEKYGTAIVVVSEEPNRTYEQELTDDLISIIHYYSMKSYGYRRKLHNAEQALKETE